MKVEKILKMKVEELEKLLSDENYDFAVEQYGSLSFALEYYQDGARAYIESLDTKDNNYLEPNAYFEAIKEQEEEYQEFLKDLFEE